MIASECNICCSPVELTTCVLQKVLSFSHLHSPHNAMQAKATFFLMQNCGGSFCVSFLHANRGARPLHQYDNSRAEKECTSVLPCSEWVSGVCVCAFDAASERQWMEREKSRKKSRSERAAHLVVMLTAAGLPLLWLTHGAVNNSSATFLIWIKQRALPLSSVAVARSLAAAQRPSGTKAALTARPAISLHTK